MSKVGASQRPTAGARYVFEKGSETDSTVVYRGVVHLPEADVALAVSVDRATLTAKAEMGEGATADLERTALSLVRTAAKHAAAEGVAWPRKIVRWRSGP